MSMTPFQSEGLELLGYTRRESDFLFLVATHSGYFTAHQFKSFLQTESGSVCHAFIRKLLERSHAAYRTYRSGERVYHLFARKLYQAIEREHLRTRKKHELDYIKTRLVALDFVLAHREHQYLETEGEKVAFFEGECGLARAILPVKLYRARRSADVTPRYFVDRFPMFVAPKSTPPRLTFTYVEAGAVTLDAFATHLGAYGGLFRALGTFEFVYIAPTARLFEASESAFQRIVNRTPGAMSASLLSYFRLRKAWDQQERVRSADVIALKEARERYTDTRFEDLYEQWLKGIASDSDIEQIAARSTDTARARFLTYRCGASLKVFADLRTKRTKNSAEGDSPMSRPEPSGLNSTQVSGP